MLIQVFKVPRLTFNPAIYKKQFLFQIQLLSPLWTYFFKLWIFWSHLMFKSDLVKILIRIWPIRHHTDRSYQMEFELWPLNQPNLPEEDVGQYWIQFVFCSVVDNKSLTDSYYYY